MKRRSEEGGWDELQDRILGLGETSTRKSYYPTLRRKLADLERAENELKRVNARLRDLVDTTPDWIWETDAEGRFVYSSPRVEDLLGYTPAEVLGRTILDFLPPAEADRARRVLGPRQRRGLPISSIVNTHLHKDGHDVVLETSGNPVFDEEGALVGYRGIARDITARVRAEDERRQLEEQMRAAQKLESLGVLAGGIAHDFNNLLTAILGNAELARSDGGISADSVARLDDVIRTSARASDLCRQMLAYAGRGRFEIEPVDLSALVREMADMIRVSVGKKVRFEVDLDEDLPAISADATQLRQVVLNLITNASEAIGDAEGCITLSTAAVGCGPGGGGCARDAACRSARRPSRCVRLVVTDDGCGMDEQTRARLFEPFFTTKFTGRGLGMAAVLGIVRGHDGDIDVHSAPGRGSRFEIHLPAVATAYRPRIEARPTGADDWKGGGTVLLADDEQAVRVLAERILRRLGFGVITARDGREAVELWNERGHEVDLVILDLTMPRLDGVEVFRRIRDGLAGRPVILTSGYTGNEVLGRLEADHPVSFLQKPFEVAALRRMIQQVMETV